MKCPICAGRKGKRGCKINSGQAVCPQCCADIRQDECSGCGYYEASQAYQKDRMVSVLKQKKFITEIIPDVEDKCDEALALVEEGKMAKGQKMLEKLWEEHPNYHAVLYGMGVCYCLQGMADEAISCLQRAIDVYPYLTQAYYNLAGAYCQKADLEKAVEALKAVIELDGKDGPLGSMAAQRLDEFEKMTRKSSGISLAAYLKNKRTFQEAFTRLKKRDFKAAIALFERVLTVEKNHVQSYGNMGLAHAGLGEKDKALECLDAALALDPEYEPAMINRLAVARLADGQCLPAPQEMREVEYYSDYKLTGKSYVRELIRESGDEVRALAPAGDSRRRTDSRR